MSLVVNHHQRAVLDFVRNSASHGVVEATAGSGKTTTLVQVAHLLESELLPPGGRACFLAFNRATAAELRDRLPDSITATTIHALGRRVLLTAFPPGKHVTNAAADDGEAAPSTTKYHDLALALLQTADAGLSHLDPHDSAQHLARLADMCRLELVDPADAAAVGGVADRYGLRSPAASGVQSLQALLPELLARGAAAGRLGDYDFTDMVYLPVRLGLRPPEYAFVCIDEAQDLSRLNLELIMRLIGVGARALFVGDPYQAIYAFAGADARSLERIVERTGATRLPLSVSFRCPVRHVVLARRFSPDMLATTKAAAGSVTVIAEAALTRSVRPGDLVMTRTNSPLVALSLSLAGRNVASRVLGDDLAAETIALARRLFPSGEIVEGHATISAAATEDVRQLERRLLTAEELPAELDRSADRHRALRLALTALERYWRLPARPPDTGTRLGKWKQRWVRSAALPTVDDLAAVLTALLGGVAGGSPLPPVVLSTIHKAKGREADRVFLYRPELLGFTSGNQEDDLAEGNVLFVALTRAKRELILVEAEQGAVAKRLASPTAGGGLDKSWTHVLRLASVMARSPGSRVGALRQAPARLIIRHGATRRVQEPGGQTGSSRRGGSRR